MPSDILNEIFSWLHPKDIVYLGRTNKHFARLLLGRKAKGPSETPSWRAFRWAWNRSFSQATTPDRPKLPDRPRDLSFPKWAGLLFVDECNFCWIREETIYWGSRVRCCKACAKSRFATLEHICTILYQAKLDTVALWGIMEKFSIRDGKVQAIKMGSDVFDSSYKMSKMLRGNCIGTQMLYNTQEARTVMKRTVEIATTDPLALVPYIQSLVDTSQRSDDFELEGTLWQRDLLR
ncbi:hypothetical protein PLICRDRAFT_176649 [Plicaturopsis crispa FD-325 SS-3]|nr:hypothetical protein PLICRDRAFT_176649 [Plicaturopsis crispa FD-325 SS-3]